MALRLRLMTSRSLCNSSCSYFDSSSYFSSTSSSFILAISCLGRCCYTSSSCCFSFSFSCIISSCCFELSFYCFSAASSSLILCCSNGDR